MNESYKNISQLKSTIIDARNINAKKITLNGQNLEDKLETVGLNLPKDYPTLVTRQKLEDDDNYMLFSDSGKMLYCSFLNKLVTGDNLFSNMNIDTIQQDMPQLKSAGQMFMNTPIKTFISKTPLLESGSNMFAGCHNLTHFEGDLTSLKNGDRMFMQCNLDTNSVLHILNNLKHKNKYTSGTYTIDLGMQDYDDYAIIELLDVEPGWTSAQLVTDKGATWNIKVTRGR